MKVKWLGHACFLITADNGKRIITDPYESGAFGGAIKHAPITERVDVVTVSHGHADHGSVAPLPGKPVALRSPGGFVAEDFEFHGTATCHDDSHGAQRGANVVFSFIVDGIKICHLGDLGHTLTGDQAADIGAVDVLLAPVGGFFTIGPEDAWTVAGQLAAKVVIPMHFKTPRVDLTIGPVDDFLKGKSSVKRLDTSEIEFAKDRLPQEREIIVLQPAL